MSYNDLASVAIDQEGSMKAYVEVEEKKRMRIMHESLGSGGSNGAPPMYHMVYTPPTGQPRQPP
jgi:hypothetical protein